MQYTSYVVSIFLVCTSITYANDSYSQSILEKKISVRVDNLSLDKTLQTIEEKARVQFIYSKEFVPIDKKVTLHCENEALSVVLEKLLKPLRIDGKLIDNQIVLKSKVERKQKKSIEVGAVFGKVTDESKQPLPGATVTVEGSTVGTVTDLQGDYFIPNAPVGDITLVVSYIGYDRQLKEVNIEDKAGIEVNFVMTSLTTELEGIIVQGNLEGQSRALNQQRNADNIKNIISADLISRFPDLNVSEALQRVSGVNIGRDNGEGAEVSIRGTPLNYTTIQINGEQIPGVGLEGDRSQSLTMFPADQLGSIEVTKSITPDMDGDAIGGTVNMRSPTAKKLTPSVKAELGSGYNNLSQGINGIGRLSYNQRFFPSDKVTEGRLGFLISGSYFQTDNGEDRTESQWERVTFEEDEPTEYEDWFLRRHDLRALETTRTRIGSGVTLDYKINNTSDIAFNFLYSSLEEDEIRQRTRFRPDDGEMESPTLSTDARMRKTYRDRVVLRDNFSYNLDGNFRAGLWDINAGGMYTTSLRDEDAISSEFEARGVDMALSDINTNFPKITSADPSVDLNDPNVFNRWRVYRPYTRTNSGSNLVGRLNLSHPYKLGEASGTIKGGYKYRFTESARDANWQIYSYEGDEENLFPRFADLNAVSGDFLNGQGGFGPGFNTGLVRDFFNANQGDFERDAQDELEQNSPNIYDASETTHASYLMTKLQFPKLMVLAGVRYENISVDYSAFELIEPEEGDLFAQPVEGGTDYDFLLPNLQLKYSFNPLTNVRFAYVRSFARPNFGDVVPSTEISIEGQNIQRGNPDILPPVANNLDILVERYLGNVGILSGGFFYKQIDNFQFNRLFIINNGDEFEGADQYIGFRAEQPENGEEAEVWGVELNALMNLDFLPGVLSGLGVYLNYTYTGSDAFTADRTGIRLPGQAEHTGNAAITYDWKGFSGRASLNYQSNFINELGTDEFGAGQSDIIRAGRYQLDINASQRIGERFRIYAEFINVTNDPQLEYFGSESRVFDVGYFSWWTRFGVSFTM